MMEFGYNMGWLVIPSTNFDKIITSLHFQRNKEVPIEEGIQEIYSNDQMFFIFSIKDKWTFIAGKLAIGTGESQWVKNFVKFVKDLSVQFGEVQAFATYRIIEYHHWIMAKEGKLNRAFAYLGESAEVITNEGALTEIELSYDWNGLEDCELIPDEDTVFDVAKTWSMSPLDLEEEVNQVGILAQFSRDALF